MPDRTELSDIFTAAVHGRSSTGADRFRVPATGAAPSDPASGRPPLSELSLAGHVLLPVTIFVVTLLAIDFSRRADFAATVWPTNAIVLVALLRHARNLRNYGSIIVGSACAIALAGVVSGNGAGPSAIRAWPIFSKSR